MGEFASGIHVYKGNKDQIIHMIPAFIQGRNYIACEGDDYDRAVAIIEAGEWVSVFDSDFDESFNECFSRQIDAHCVAINLVDGDCLEAILWKKGRRVNTYISDPDYLELRRTKSNCGNALRWKPVTKDIDNLQSVFDSEDDATAKLYYFSEVLGIQNRFSQMHYGIIDEIDDVDITYIKFREFRM